MTLTKIKRIENHIASLQKELEEARDQYIKENARFKKGDRVIAQLLHMDIEACVSEPMYYESFKGDGIHYMLFKPKKDGTASKRRACELKVHQDELTPIKP